MERWRREKERGMREWCREIGRCTCLHWYGFTDSLIGVCNGGFRAAVASVRCSRTFQEETWLLMEKVALQGSNLSASTCRTVCRCLTAVITTAHSHTNCTKLLFSRWQSHSTEIRTALPRQQMYCIIYHSYLNNIIYCRESAKYVN